MFNRTKKHIFISCSPKSGSTYLLQLFAALLDYDIRIFIAAFDRTEQDVFEESIIKAKKLNTVTHQHTRCTNNTLEILNRHAIKPVILTRSLYDSVISMRNHLINEPNNSWFPMAYIDENFYTLSIERQYDFVIDLMVPWYINYYVAWDAYMRDSGKEPLWITYEQLMRDKIATINKVLNYYDIDRTIDKELLVAIEKQISGKTRKTVFKDNEIKVDLTVTQKDRIKAYTKYYPNVNFDKYQID